MLTYPRNSACPAITTRLRSVGALVPYVVLDFDSAHCSSAWSASSCNHKRATSIWVVLCVPIPRLWRMCSVAFTSITITDFNVHPESLIIDTMPFDSHAPRAAAYNDASTLLLAIFSLCVYMLATCDCRSVSHQRWKN